MTPQAALLRAVNVGGVRIAMADLRAVGIAAGLVNVRTFRNSGNLLFEAGTGTPQRHAATISAALTELAGRPVPVIVRTSDQLRRAADTAQRLFAEQQERTLAVAFLDQPVPDAAQDRLGSFDDERYVVDGDNLHLCYPRGQARSRLTLDVIEKRLGVVGTVRGLPSVQGMVALLGG